MKKHYFLTIIIAGFSFWVGSNNSIIINESSLSEKITDQHVFINKQLKLSAEQKTDLETVHSLVSNSSRTRSEELQMQNQQDDEINVDIEVEKDQQEFEQKIEEALSRGESLDALGFKKGDTEDLASLNSDNDSDRRLSELNLDDKLNSGEHINPEEFHKTFLN